MSIYLGNTKIGGIKIGTVNSSATVTDPNLITLNVTPQETSQTFTPSGNIDGYSRVSVEAISSTYVGSEITRQNAQTFTPGTTNQFIAANTYLTATQTILGDADLIPANIKAGINIFGVTGNYVGERTLQDNKIVYPNTLNQTITPDAGYSGLSSVIVQGVTTSNLTAGNIAAGTVVKVGDAANAGRIANITGTFTSDANAIAENILYNKTAYVNGLKITGSMPNNGEISGTITTQNGTYSIPEGYTSGGTVTATLAASTLSNTIINGAAILEATNDYAFEVTVNVPSGYHNATTLTKTFSSILPAPDTEGTSSQVLVGYDLYNHDGQLITGSMTNNGSWNRTLSGSTLSVTIPQGYHNGTGTVSVAQGSATAPTSISGTTATVSTGTNTLTLTKTVSVTPRVTTAGYISAGTAGNSSVSLTANVTTKAAATITPGTSAQTIAAGTYLTGTQTIAGDTDLVAANIKTGVNIFGITGNYTSDATASAAEINSGYTAYINGEKVTGTQVIQHYYTGTAAPSSSLGVNGDIYLQLAT